MANPSRFFTVGFMPPPRARVTWGRGGADGAEDAGGAAVGAGVGRVVLGLVWLGCTPGPAVSAWVALRLLKFLAVALFAAGIVGAAASPRQSERARAAFGLATPGLVAVSLAGFLLLKSSGRSLAEPFAALGLLVGVAAVLGALLAARASPSFGARALGPAALGVATAVMVTRDSPAPVATLAAVGAAALGVGLVAALPSPDDEVDPRYTDRVRAAFRAVAWAEGASLLALVVVNVPLRRLTGYTLDGGTGALGWVHGTLFLVYLAALPTTRQALGWTGARTVLAVVAGLVPFGTFAFDRSAR